MTRLTLAAALGALALALVPLGGAATRPAPLDKHWLQDTAHGNLFEIAGARIARARATTPAVRDLAIRLEADHTRGQETLQRVAAKVHVPIGSQPSPTQHWELHILTTLSGPAFDRMYAWLEVADHVQSLQDAQEAAKDASSSAVRALARSLLPTLREHLRLANAAKKAAG